MENLLIIVALLTVCNSFLLLLLLRLFMERRNKHRENKEQNLTPKTHCVDSLEDLYDIFVKVEGDKVFVLDENKYYIFTKNAWKST